MVINEFTCTDHIVAETQRKNNKEIFKLFFSSAKSGIYKATLFHN